MIWCQGIVIIQNSFRNHDSFIVSIPFIHLYLYFIHLSICYLFFLVVYLAYIDRLLILCYTTLHFITAKRQIKAIHLTTFGNKHNKAELDKDTITPPLESAFAPSITKLSIHRVSSTCTSTNSGSLTCHSLDHTTYNGGYRADFSVAIDVSLGVG